jgi:hypothetical protein
VGDIVAALAAQPLELANVLNLGQQRLGQIPDFFSVHPSADQPALGSIFRYFEKKMDQPSPLPSQSKLIDDTEVLLAEIAAQLHLSHPMKSSSASRLSVRPPVDSGNGSYTRRWFLEREKCFRTEPSIQNIIH